MTKDDLTIIERFFPAGSAILAAPVDDYLDELDTLESGCVANAVEKRRAEFSTGRFLAHEALRQLGQQPQPIDRDPLNSPVWPDGIVGSISHTNEDCVVVAATVKESAGVGIDLERSDADVSGISELVMRADEIEGYSAIDDVQMEHVLRLHFSAKEAIYKAVYPTVQRFIEFQEVRINVDSKTGHFSATADDDSTLNDIVSAGTGICVELGELVFGGFYLPASIRAASFELRPS